ncbi:uncharacterized protein LOC119415878 [Nematolebias whitei]|uniref:uncharacterized protein LOC119415878 n=1 Tax=Nematolebias whitei TaxID=451745 RepID=UPI0018992FCB|nr:uncharacterized protein LOC119415878 [Nematolebias whitei]
MLPQRILSLLVCCEVIVSQLHTQETRTTFSPDEPDVANKNPHRRRWRTFSWRDNRKMRGASGLFSWPDSVNPESSELRETRRSWRAVHKSDVQNRTEPFRSESGNVRTATEPRGASCGLGEEPHRAKCMTRSNKYQQRHGPNQRSSRVRRSDPLGDSVWEAPAGAMAQGQDIGHPIILNTSDYEEEYSLPDFHDTTLEPMNPRTPRKPLKNPFYPPSMDAYRAYAMTLAAAAIFSTGIIGNVVLMCIVCHNYYMRSISNSLLANLALWDFIIIFFCLPLVVFHALTKKWLLGEFSCRIIPYLEVRGEVF